MSREFFKGMTYGWGSRRGVPAKYFKFLDPALAATITENEHEFVLLVYSRAYARYVELELTTDDCLFSDNYFDLSSDQPVTITVAKTSLSRQISLQEMKQQLRLRSVYDLDEAAKGSVL